MAKSNFLQEVQRGLEGKGRGLPNNLGTMNDSIYGTQQSRYYLIGGESGSGKTTIADSAFILTPYAAIANNENDFGSFKLSVTYFSFEQSSRTKQSKWASHIIYQKHNIWIPPTLALGKTKRLLKDHEFKYCVEANDTLEQMLDSIEIIDQSYGPSDIMAFLIRYGSKKGKWVTAPKLDAEGRPMLNKAKKPLLDIVGWTPNDPDERHIIQVDHIAYANIEKRSLKENIDFISRTFVKFREITHSWTFVVIQQFNTELSSVERQKFKKSALAPQRVDFGDSRYTFQDADVVFGAINPYKYDILDNFQGYQDIGRFNGLAIWLFLMKNRHEGAADLAIPYLMDPVAITTTEIPDPEDTKVQVELGMIKDPLLDFYEKSEEISNLKKLYI